MVVNFTNVVTEFIGIAGSLQLFHVTKFISVPVCAALVWVMVVKGNYKSTEKIFLVASLVYIAYIFAGVLSQPELEPALDATFRCPKVRVERQSLRLHGDRHCGHHDCAVDAVLPAVVDCGERDSPQGLTQPRGWT